MKSIKFDDTTLITKFATTFGWEGYWVEDERNICSLTKHVITGLVVTAVFCALAVLSAILVGNLIAWIAWMVLNLSWILPNEPAFGGIVALVFGGTIGFIAWVNAHGHSVTAHTPSIVKAAYRSWKDKMCVRLEYETMD